MLSTRRHSAPTTTRHLWQQVDRGTGPPAPSLLAQTPDCRLRAAWISLSLSTCDSTAGRRPGSHGGLLLSPDLNTLAKDQPRPESCFRSAASICPGDGSDLLSAESAHDAGDRFHLWSSPSAGDRVGVVSLTPAADASLFLCHERDDLLAPLSGCFVVADAVAPRRCLAAAKSIVAVAECDRDRRERAGRLGSVLLVFPRR